MVCREEYVFVEKDMLRYISFGEILEVLVEIEKEIVDIEGVLGKCDVWDGN